MASVVQLLRRPDKGSNVRVQAPPDATYLSPLLGHDWIMTPAEETLARIKARREEQTRLYRILDLWAAVQAQGTAPEEVESFGFDPKLLPPTLGARAPARNGAGTRSLC